MDVRKFCKCLRKIRVGRVKPNFDPASYRIYTSAPLACLKRVEPPVLLLSDRSGGGGSVLSKLGDQTVSLKPRPLARLREILGKQLEERVLVLRNGGAPPEAAQGDSSFLWHLSLIIYKQVERVKIMPNQKTCIPLQKLEGKKKRKTHVSESLK